MKCKNSLPEGFTAISCSLWFTYFLPTPPKRKTGYQEKEFDRIVSHIISLGFAIKDIKLSTVSGTLSSGMWILCLLEPLTPKAAKMNLEITYSDVTEKMSSHIPMDPMIEHE